MRKATLIRPQTIEISEVEKPVIKEDEVLIAVKYIGICGSDIHAYYGKHPFMSCPITLGHEGAGVIAEVGSAVSGFKVGDRVTYMPQLFCNACEPCLSGRYNICTSLKVIGCQTAGAAVDYMPCPASLLKKIPDSMSYELAATIEPVAVGVHAAQRTEIAGKNALVIGAGTIGNLTAQACSALGANSVMIADLSDYRLGVAKECGIPHTVNTGKEDLAEAVKKAFGDKGCDVIFECIGLEATTNQAINLAKKGSDVIIVGVYGQRPAVDMGLVQDRELRLIGTLMYLEDDYDKTIAFMDRGKINTAPLISKKFPLDEYQQAFEYIEKNADTSIKVLVEISE